MTRLERGELFYICLLMVVFAMFSAIYSFHCSFERLISDGKNVVADLDVFGCKRGQSY
jgi:predicted ester cyclase